MMAAIDSTENAVMSNFANIPDFDLTMTFSFTLSTGAGTHHETCSGSKSSLF